MTSYSCMSAPNHFYGSAMTIPSWMLKQPERKQVDVQNIYDDPVAPEIVETANEPDMLVRAVPIGGDTSAEPIEIETENDDIVDDEDAQPVEGQGFSGGYYNVLPFANPVSIIPVGGSLAAEYNLQTELLPIVNDGIMPAADIDNAFNDSWPAVIVPAEDVIKTNEGYGLRKHGGAIRAYGYRTGDGNVLYASGFGNLFKKIANVAKKGLTKGVQVAKNVGKTVGKDLLGNLATTAVTTLAGNALDAVTGGAIIAKGLHGGSEQDSDSMPLSTFAMAPPPSIPPQQEPAEILPPPIPPQQEPAVEILSAPNLPQQEPAVLPPQRSNYKRSIIQAVKAGAVALSLLGSMFFKQMNTTPQQMNTTLQQMNTTQRIFVDDNDEVLQIPPINETANETTNGHPFVPVDYPWSTHRKARAELIENSYEQPSWPKSSDRYFKHKEHFIPFPGDEDKSEYEYRRAISRMDLDRMLDMVNDGNVDMIPYITEEDKARLKQIASPFQRFNFMLERGKDGDRLANDYFIEK